MWGEEGGRWGGGGEEVGGVGRRRGGQMGEGYSMIHGAFPWVEFHFVTAYKAAPADEGAPAVEKPAEEAAAPAADAPAADAPAADAPAADAPAADETAPAAEEPKADAADADAAPPAADAGEDKTAEAEGFSSGFGFRAMTGKAAAHIKEKSAPHVEKIGANTTAVVSSAKEQSDGVPVAEQLTGAAAEAAPADGVPVAETAPLTEEEKEIAQMRKELEEYEMSFPLARFSHQVIAPSCHHVIVLDHSAAVSSCNMM